LLLVIIERTNGKEPAIFDVKKFTTHLRSNAVGGFGKGQCAKYVRLALEVGGANTAAHPRDAKDWGGTLVRIGFRELDVPKLDVFMPIKGDVAVIQSTSTSSSGHIQGFDGRNWISDFVQNAFSPGANYRAEKPKCAIYRP
jgi:hypothetical protein